MPSFTRTAAMASPPDRGSCYTSCFVRSYIMHVKIARKKARSVASARDGREETRVWYSCVAITWCYALPIIGFIRTKFAKFVPRETRMFRIPFDTQVGRIGTRIFPNAAFSSFRACEEAFFTRASLLPILFLRSLSPVQVSV